MKNAVISFLTLLLLTSKVFGSELTESSTYGFPGKPVGTQQVFSNILEQQENISVFSKIGDVEINYDDKIIKKGAEEYPLTPRGKQVAFLVNEYALSG